MDRRLVTAFVSGLALSALLVAGGYRLATILSDDSPTADRRQTVGSLTDAVDGSPDTAPAPALLLPGFGEVEPVAAAAEVLAPSVVQINTDEGLGSGIVWDDDKGYIITNHHVVSEVDNVQVTFENGLVVNGRVVGGDSARDVAVVRIDPAGIDLVAAQFVGSDAVSVGQLAVAVGHPFNLDQSVTAGVVSNADWVNDRGGSDQANPVPVRMIQTDAPINPGNSGGALADRHGRVIGMNTSIFTGGDMGNDGVGFAVPSETVLLIAERIVNGESLELGYLGVEGSSLTDGTAGAEVALVVPNGPAESGGIMVDDLIVSLNGRAINSMDGLSAEVKLYRPGEEIVIEVLRDGESVVLTVLAGRFEDAGVISEAETDLLPR